MGESGCTQHRGPCHVPPGPTTRLCAHRGRDGPQAVLMLQPEGRKSSLGVPPRPRTSLSVWIEQPALESQSVGRDFQSIPVRKHAWLSVDTLACGQLIRRSGATDVYCHEGKPGGVPSQVAAVGRGRGGHSGTRGGRAGVAGAQGSSVLCDVLASAGVPGGRRPRSLVSADGQVGGVHGLSPLTPGPPAPSCFCHIWLFF